jgi:hypothetical protein
MAALNLLARGRCLTVLARGWGPVGPQTTGRSRARHARSHAAMSRLIGRWPRMCPCPRHTATNLPPFPRRLSCRGKGDFGGGVLARSVTIPWTSQGHSPHSKTNANGHGNRLEPQRRRRHDVGGGPRVRRRFSQALPPAWPQSGPSRVRGGHSCLAALWPRRRDVAKQPRWPAFPAPTPRKA